MISHISFSVGVKTYIYASAPEANGLTDGKIIQQGAYHVRVVLEELFYKQLVSKLV